MKKFIAMYLPSNKREIIIFILQVLIILFHFIDIEIFSEIKIMEDYLAFSYSSTVIILLGIILMIISIKDLGRNISPFANPKLDSILITKGIYSKITHPMYLSLRLISFGLFLRNPNLFHFLLFLSLVIILKVKERIEENYLSIKFKTYKNYKKDKIY